MLKQRIFHKRLNVAENGKLSCRNTLHLWPENFRMSVYTLKKLKKKNVKVLGVQPEYILLLYEYPTAE
jgi:hypothetical protein